MVLRARADVGATRIMRNPELRPIMVPLLVEVHHSISGVLRLTVYNRAALTSGQHFPMHVVALPAVFGWVAARWP